MISAVINARNEEKNLPACLDALAWCDEQIVVDMESEDATATIARGRGARVFSYPNVGYVEPARAFAVEQARGPWVLIVDADELIPFTLAERLRAIAAADEFDAVAIPHKNYLLGEWVRHSGWWPDYHWRFFRRGALRFTDRIHDSVAVLGRRLTLPAEEPLAIVHLHHADITHFLERINRYTSIEARNQPAFRPSQVWIAPLRQFLFRYVRCGGYRAGYRGLFLALLMAYYDLVASMKRWEQREYTRTGLPDDRYAATRDALLAAYAKTPPAAPR
jgi:glycosyltransferase involved in cell wall biosynthesis